MPARTPTRRSGRRAAASACDLAHRCSTMSTGLPRPMTAESCVRLLQEVPKLAVLLEPVRLIFCPNAKAGTTTVNTLLRTLLDSRYSGPQRQRPIVASSHVVRAGQRESLANHTEHGRMNASRAQAFCRYSGHTHIRRPLAEPAVWPCRSGEVFSFTIARNPWSRVSHFCHLPFLPGCVPMRLHLTVCDTEPYSGRLGVRGQGGGRQSHASATPQPRQDKSLVWTWQRCVHILQPICALARA